MDVHSARAPAQEREPRGEGIIADLGQLKQLYQVKFDKKPRGRYANDAAWLQKKLGVEWIQKELGRSGEVSVQEASRQGDDEVIEGSVATSNAPPPGKTPAKPQSCSLGNLGTSNSPLRVKSSLRMEKVSRRRVERHASHAKSAAVTTSTSNSAAIKGDSPTEKNRGKTIDDAQEHEPLDPPMPKKANSNASKKTNAYNNKFAKLGVGASSWLFAEATPKSETASNHALSTMSSIRKHAFGSSTQDSKISSKKSSFLNFDARTTTKGGRRINVATMQTGPALPWEKSRGVTKFSNDSEKDDAHPLASTLQSRKAKSSSKTESEKWWQLPEQEITPDVRRELEIIKMRNYLNPKRFYKANDSKSLSKRFQFGTIISGAFEGRASNLTRAQRRETIAGELMADKRTRKYTRRVFNSVQEERKPPPKKRRKGGHKHNNRRR